MDNSMQWKKVTQRSATKPLLYGALAAIVQALISWMASADLPAAVAGFVPVIVALLQFALVEVKKQSMAQPEVEAMLVTTHAPTWSTSQVAQADEDDDIYTGSPR